MVGTAMSTSNSRASGVCGQTFTAVVTLFALVGPTAAVEWPSRPLTLVVPFAAGGPSDVAGRILAQGLSEALGQQVVVENPSGAGGTVGSLRVAKAAPDGYQFVLGNSGTHAWSQSLYKKPPYDTLADFTPLGLVVKAPRVIITPKTLPANSLPEFIAYIKANQATAKFGSAGAGSASHVSCILLNAALGVDVTHVPYRGLDRRPHRLRLRLGLHVVAAAREQHHQGDCHDGCAPRGGARETRHRARAGTRF
jgi:tripartite-type tricarboxylate transporter receptor subunit TctC